MRGELKYDPSRIGDDALAEGLTLQAALRDGSQRTLRVLGFRMHKGRPLVRFAGVDDATAAAPLVGATLTIPRDAVVLREGEYLDADLVGCVLIDADAPAPQPLAQVSAVEHYPAQDVLIVRVAATGRSAIVPLVRAFVRDVDVARKRIAVALPAGLLDDAEALRDD